MVKLKGFGYCIGKKGTLTIGKDDDAIDKFLLACFTCSDGEEFSPSLEEQLQFEDDELDEEYVIPDISEEWRKIK